MMRIVFLLFAEERGLLPSGELFEQGYGISGELDRLDARETDESEEALDATSLTWHRLLATSQALYRGASFENLRMPAYGGSLFDPDRFPFLTATTEHGTLARHGVRPGDAARAAVGADRRRARARRAGSRSATSTSSRSATSTRACSATPASPSTRRTSG